MTVSFSENSDCNINPRNKSGLHLGLDNISQDNVITKAFLNKNEDLAKLLGYQKRSLTAANINTNTMKASDAPILDNKMFGFVEEFEVDEACSYVENLNLNSNLINIGIGVAIVFLIIAICLLVICCKYRGVKNNYQRLLEETEVSEIPHVAVPKHNSHEPEPSYLDTEHKEHNHDHSEENLPQTNKKSDVAKDSNSTDITKEEVSEENLQTEKPDSEGKIDA